MKNREPEVRPEVAKLARVRWTNKTLNEPTKNHNGLGGGRRGGAGHMHTLQAESDHLRNLLQHTYRSDYHVQRADAASARSSGVSHASPAPFAYDD